MPKYIRTITAMCVFICTGVMPCLGSGFPTANLTIRGGEQGGPGNWDSGTITVTVNGHSESVSYGQYSTPASVAAAFGAKFAEDPISALPRLCTVGVCAKANGSTISFQLSSGSFTQLSVVGPTNSFQVDQSAWPGGGSVAPSTGQLVCSPSAIYVGGSVACFVNLPAGSTQDVSFFVDGVANTIGSPDSLSAVETSVDLSTLTAGTHAVSYAYPSGSTSPTLTNSTNVTVVAQGNPLPSGQSVYSFLIQGPSETSGYDPTGNILNYSDSMNGLWSLQYTFNRLDSGSVTPQTASQASYLCWSYDDFGNRTGQVLSNQSITSTDTACQPTGSTYAQSVSSYEDSGSPDAHTNRVTSGSWQNSQGIYQTASPQYDAAGNLVNTGMTGDQPQYAYDGEGRLCAFQDASGQVYQYLYDAEGNRVAKGKSSSTVVSCDLSTFALTNEYIVDQSGQPITEVDGNGNWVHTNAYTNGELIATFTPPAGAPPSPSTDSYALHYQLTDWEGTRRMQVSPGGQVEEGWQNLPYGDQLYPVPDTTDATEQHFTGKERDTESGNDYFGARYYGSSMGRFISPDWSGSPSPVPFADYGEPQSLNLYAYVGNNPLSSIDPDGHGPPCLDAHGEPCKPPAPPRPGDPYSVDFDDLLLEGFSFTPIPLNEQSLHQMPIPRGNTATISAYHPSVGTCLREAAIDAGLDLTSLSLLPSANQDDWHWSSAKFGFVYTGSGESALGPSSAVDVTEQVADWVADTPRAQAEIRQLLRSAAVKVSLKHVSKDSALVGKVAGAFGAALTAKSAYDRYQKCRGYR